MYLVSTDVSLTDCDTERLLGASIDVPRPGQPWAAASLPVEGWVVGRSEPVRRVEIVADGQVCGLTEPSLNRPDVAVHLGVEGGALTCGFQTIIDATALGDGTFVVDAVLSSGARARVGHGELRRYWRPADTAGQRMVSVIIPCYNQAHFLADAIESALRQSHASVEIVVVDDGSLDNTRMVARRYPAIRYVYQRNAGLAAARNTGIRHSSGEFLVFLDADDRLSERGLASSVQYLVDHPQCAFVSGEHRYIGVTGEILAEWQRPAVDAGHYLAFLKGNYIACPAAVLYRRSVFHAAKGFDRRFNPCEDYELYLRIARQFPVGAHGELVAEYRRYGGSMSDDPGKMLRASLTVLQQERRYVRGDPVREAAFAEGRRQWRMHYARPLALNVRTSLNKKGKRMDAARGMLQLARHAPAYLMNLVRRRR